MMRVIAKSDTATQCCEALEQYWVAVSELAITRNIRNVIFQISLCSSHYDWKSLWSTLFHSLVKCQQKRTTLFWV